MVEPTLSVSDASQQLGDPKVPHYVCKQGKTLMNERYFVGANDDELTQKGY